MDENQTKKIYSEIIKTFISEVQKDQLFVKKLRDSGIEFIKEVILTLELAKEPGKEI